MTSFRKPQGGVRRRPKKVPLSFSALARGALQAPGCAEDRHSPPAGPPEGRRRQWCARRIDDERTWVKQRDTKGSWIVDRGSWIVDRRSKMSCFAWDMREEMMPTSNKFLLFDVGSRNHFTKKSNLSKFYKKTSDLATAP